MYSNYSQITLGSFKFWSSTDLKAGEIHKKMFTEELTTTENAETFNVYINGSFKISIPSINFEQIMNKGQTSLDINIGHYPLNAVVNEIVLEDKSSRICIKNINNVSYNRNIIDVADSLTLDVDQIAILLDGSLSVNNEPISIGNPQILQKQTILNGVGKVLLISEK